MHEPRPMMAVRWRVARVLMLTLGVTLLAVLVSQNDPAALLASIRQLSWRIVIVLAFPFALVNALDTLGWRFAFRRDRVPFSTLFSARLAGEAFNLTTPTASLGGEAIKAWLVRRHVSIAEGFTSVIVAKTTITVAQGLLLVVGLPCAWLLLPAGSPLLRIMAWLLVIEVVAVAAFVVVQLSGAFAGGGRALGRFPMIARLASGLGRVDESLAHFYRREPVRLTLSIFFHFLGWLASALETWLILSLLGIDVSLLTATLIEAFSTAVRFATFMVPASLGALEGGNVALFGALGLGATAGMSFSLVRRLREATWIGIGFLALAAYRGLAPAAALSTPKG
ncbi:MAG TPA: flippase-like domain-containing protein [Methylomirabilota bacterium]|nr:flippase-like domain-containing protein [Methylomirabilota bacterium]